MGNTLDSQSISVLRQVVAWWRAHKPDPVRRQIRFRNNAGDGRRFFNSYPETVPAYGVMAIIGDYTLNGEKILNIDKPSTTFRRVYAVNGSVPVAYNDSGICYLTGPRKILYDSGTPAYGEAWGPKPGQWSLAKYYPAICDVDFLDDSTGLVLQGQIHAIDKVIGKAGIGIAKGTTGTVTIWGGNAEASLSMTVANCRALGAAITAAKFVVVDWINGVPYVGVWEC